MITQAPFEFQHDPLGQGQDALRAQTFTDVLATVASHWDGAQANRNGNRAGQTDSPPLWTAFEHNPNLQYKQPHSQDAELHQMFGAPQQREIQQSLGQNLLDDAQWGASFDLGSPAQQQQRNVFPLDTLSRTSPQDQWQRQIFQPELTQATSSHSDDRRDSQQVHTK